MPVNMPRILLLAASLAASPALLAQGMPPSGGNVELLNQIAILRSEMQSLRAEIEELQRVQQQQADTARAQYLDLDGRLVRLEGGTPVATAPAAATIVEVDAEAGTDTRADLAGADQADPVPAAGPSDPAREQADYLAAFEALKGGDYVESARAFEEFLVRHPGGTYAPNALYWLGESYYVTQNYAMAERQFRAVLAQFPRHDKAAGALLKVGLSQYGQDEFEAAAGTLAEVVARYPGTDVARTAEDALRSMRLTGR